MEINRLQDQESITPAQNQTGLRGADVDKKVEETITDDNSSKQQTAPVSEEEQQQISEEVAGLLKEDIEKINQVVALYNKELRFILHESSERRMVEVVNSETQEVIKEIPPREFLDWVGKFHALLGAMIDATM